MKLLSVTIGISIIYKDRQRCQCFGKGLGFFFFLDITSETYFYMLWKLPALEFTFSNTQIRNCEGG